MRTTWGAGLLVLGLLVAGCSGAGDDATAASSGGDDAGATPTTVALDAASSAGGSFVAADQDESAGGGGATGSLTATEALPDPSTRVIRTAEVRIEVKKGAFAEMFRSASSLARSLGGFVQSSSTSSYEEGVASGDVTIRVPVDRYDDALTRLGKLGKVESSAEEGQDVTDQLVDLDARLRSLRAEEAAMDALLSKAGSIQEILSIRDTTSGIRQQIEQLAAQQASLQDRTTFATIHAELHEANAVIAETTPSDDGWDLARALHTGVDAAEAIVGSLIVAVGIALPLLPFALVGVLVARRRRRAEATVVATEG
jgi:hypothetical protein